MLIHFDQSVPTCGRLAGSSCLRVLLCLPFFLVGAVSAFAAEPEVDLVSFSREEKQDALRQIPLNRIAPEHQNRVATVLHDPSIFRRLPVQVIDCDPELYSFLVSYPEIVVNIWELMGITNVNVQRVSSTQFHANDGAGTVSTVTVLYADNDTKVFLAEGYYEGSLTPKRITAECILVLKSGYTQTPQGKAFVSNRLDVFVKFDSKGAELLARTLHPFIGKTADFNFAESSAFLGKISKSSEDNMPGMQNLISKLDKVDPAVRHQMSEIVTKVYRRRLAMEVELQNELATSQAASGSRIAPLVVEPTGRRSARQPAVVVNSEATDSVSLEPGRLPQGTLAQGARPLVVDDAPSTEDADKPLAFAPVPRKRYAELRR